MSTKTFDDDMFSTHPLTKASEDALLYDRYGLSHLGVAGCQRFY
ncbi:MAG: hypothetical protein ACX93T_00900 [Bacteroidota bacterium]